MERFAQLIMFVRTGAGLWDRAQSKTANLFAPGITGITILRLELLLEKPACASPSSKFGSRGTRSLWNCSAAKFLLKNRDGDRRNEQSCARNRQRCGQ